MAVIYRKNWTQTANEKLQVCVGLKRTVGIRIWLYRFEIILLVLRYYNDCIAR